MSQLDRRRFLGVGAAAGLSSLLPGRRAFGQEFGTSSLLTAAAPTGSTSGAASAHVEGNTIIVQPTWVVVPDAEKLKLLRDHDVVIKGDRIDEVRPRKSGRDRTVVAHGQILLAGFISGHTHSAAGTMTHGFIEENSFASVQTDDPSIPEPLRCGRWS